VVPLHHQPLALPSGEVIVFEDGFNSNHQRWLRAHRRSGGSWVVEDVADLSWTYTFCNGFGGGAGGRPTVRAVDPLGQPHILFASQPEYSSTMIEDHYRDATGWRVRTFPLSRGRPLDMVIDATGTTHILAEAAGLTTGTTRLVSIRIDATAW